MICSFCQTEYDELPYHSTNTTAYDPSTCSLTCTKKKQSAEARERARARNQGEMARAAD